MMTCPICSLYFQDVEQEAFRHHACSRHGSSAVFDALKANGSAWRSDATHTPGEAKGRDPEDDE